MTFKGLDMFVNEKFRQCRETKMAGDQPSCVSIFEHVPRDVPSRVGMDEGGRTPIHGHRGGAVAAMTMSGRVEM